MGSCIIIGAGDFEQSELLIEADDFVIAADGGYAYCKALGIEPDYIIGDMDSLGKEEKEKLLLAKEQGIEQIKILPCEKDDTDMMSAIREGLKRGYKKFRLYGAMGGRLEHTIANIQCLLYLKNRGADGMLIEKKRSVFLLCEESISFPKEKEGFFSMFALQQQAEGVTIRKMKYPLEEAVISAEYPIGISNEFIGQEAWVSVKKGTLLCMTSDF